MRTRWLAPVGVPAGVLIALWLARPASAADDLVQGKILIADRKLADPNFFHTVVYLITYDEQGAVGLILNRETEAPVSKILSGVKEAANRKDSVFSGGPVEPASLLALYRTKNGRKGARLVSRDVYAVLDETVLKEALAAGADDTGLRFYTGYAGWGPGQLDTELAAGAWYVVDGDARTVFDQNPATLWDRLIRRKDELVARNPGPRSRLRLAFAVLH
jgi:putative transcriptional regulator